MARSLFTPGCPASLRLSESTLSALRESSLPNFSFTASSLHVEARLRRALYLLPLLPLNNESLLGSSRDPPPRLPNFALPKHTRAAPRTIPPPQPHFLILLCLTPSLCLPPHRFGFTLTLAEVFMIFSFIFFLPLVIRIPSVSQSLCPHWLLTLVRSCCFVDL